MEGNGPKQTSERLAIRSLLLAHGDLGLYLQLQRKGWHAASQLVVHVWSLESSGD